MYSSEKTQSKPESEQRLVKQIKVLELEKSLAGRRGFWKGLAAGFLLIWLLLLGAGVLMWVNKEKVLEFAVSHFLMDYAENVFAGFPEAYMTNNRERVLATLDEFTNAMAGQRVNREHFRAIFREIFSALRDQRLTYQEMDTLLQRLEQAARATE